MIGKLYKDCTEEEKRKMEEEMKSYTTCIGEPIRPMIVWQPLCSAIEEFIAAVRMIKTEFNLSTSEATEIVLELKRMGLPHEVK